MDFLAGAFASWLVEQFATGARGRVAAWLLGDEEERALRQAAGAAVRLTAGEMFPDDHALAAEVETVVAQVFGGGAGRVRLAGHTTLLEGLQASIAGQLAPLGDRGLTGAGVSSADVLGVSGRALAETLTAHLLREIVDRGSHGGPLTPLAAQLNHDATHLQVRQVEGILGRLAGEMAAMRTGSSGEDGAIACWSVHELPDPFALEVHRPIQVAAGPGRGELPPLPAYITRDHDRRLHGIAAAAAAGSSAIVVLVGGSSTGKTRAGWEAVQTLPPDWRLWHPVFPDRAEALLDGLTRVEPRTVVWLNDAQFYLLTSDPQTSERAAAGLRELLRDRRRAPVLVLGTIWPMYWRYLTAEPDDGGPDLHANARALVSGAAIQVPDAFTGADWAALVAAADADPRLAAARDHAQDGEAAQFLAGAPALLERYHTAPPTVRAVIHAAMDARMLGHGPALSRALLEAAASGYLTDRQRGQCSGQEWMDQVLAYAAAPCRGTRGPLTPIHPLTGLPGQAQPHYRLADYLEQTGHATRIATPPPASQWAALVAYAARGDLRQLGDTADRRCLRRLAFQLYAAAADAGDHAAARVAAEALNRRGRASEALAWLVSRAEAGDVRALLPAASALRDAGRIEEAVSFCQRAAHAGDTDALWPAARMLGQLRGTDAAIGWLGSRAEAGVPGARRLAAVMLKRAWRTQEAITWSRMAVETGDAGALSLTAELMRDTDRLDEAVTWLQSRANAGDSEALTVAVSMLKEAGRIDQAVALCLYSAQGDGRVRAAQLLEEAGRREEATALYRSAADVIGLEYSWGAAELLKQAGRFDDAVIMCKRAAEAGDVTAQSQVMALLQDAGRADEALAWLQARAEAGNALALDLAAGLLTRSGRVADAMVLSERLDPGGPVLRKVSALALSDTGQAEQTLAVILQSAQGGDADILTVAAGMLRSAGRHEDALAYYVRAAEGGSNSALWIAAQMLAEADRVEEAMALCERRAEAGQPHALSRAAHLLRQAGRHEEALGYFRRAAQGGDPEAWAQAAETLRHIGRPADAVALFLTAAETGEPNSLWWSPELDRAARRADDGEPEALRSAADLLRRQGRQEDAGRLLLYGLEPGGQIAAPWNVAPRDQPERTVPKAAAATGPSAGAGAPVTAADLTSHGAELASAVTNWSGSAMVVDPGSALWNVTAERRRAMGSHIVRFSMTGGQGKSVSYNPLREIRRHTAHELSDLTETAKLLTDDPSDEGEATALLMLAVLVRYLEDAPEPSLPALAEFVAPPSFFSGAQLVSYLSNIQDYTLQAHLFAAALADEFTRYDDKDLIENCLQRVIHALAPFRAEPLASHTQCHDLALAALTGSDQPVTLYVTLPQSDTEQLRPFFLLLSAQLRRGLHAESPPGPFAVFDGTETLRSQSLAHVTAAPIVASSPAATTGQST